MSVLFTLTHTHESNGSTLSDIRVEGFTCRTRHQTNHYGLAVISNAVLFNWLIQVPIRHPTKD